MRGNGLVRLFLFQRAGLLSSNFFHKFGSLITRYRWSDYYFLFAPLNLPHIIKDLHIFYHVMRNTWQKSSTKCTGPVKGQRFEIILFFDEPALSNKLFGFMQKMKCKGLQTKLVTVFRARADLVI